MKYIVTLVWSFILGQVVYYLGSALTSARYDLMGGTLLALTIAISVVLVARVIESVQKDTPTQTH